ncbi:TatD family hydrolase [Candidatus Woesearchaeota archaeon]|nr:TatD family hydrolase [Candidatus Woesearchaeota archaeon]
MIKNLIDCHAHVDFKFDLNKLKDDDPFKKLAKTFNTKKIIDNAIKNNVVAIINNGTNPETNKNCLKLSKEFPIIKSALGMYPTDGLEFSETEIDKEIEFIKKNKKNIIAIGEIGLDNYLIDMNKKQKKKMNDNFLKMLELASSIKKPVIIHSRKAEKEEIDILSSFDIKAQMHCYGGKLKLAKQAIEQGIIFSIPPNIVKNQAFEKLVEITPINQLLTETDTPFLSPHKDKLNEPSNVIYSIKKIAEIKDLDEQETANLIFSNYQNIFL